MPLDRNVYFDSFCVLVTDFASEPCIVAFGMNSWIAGTGGAFLDIVRSATHWTWRLDGQTAEIQHFLEW